MAPSDIAEQCAGLQTIADIFSFDDSLRNVAVNGLST
jgi:hypothetical protein